MSVGSGPSSERDADAHQVFMRLADASLPTSYRLAAHLLGDTSEAEDATQEALLLAWRGWPRLRDPERFGAWFDRILVNVCYERLRRHRRSPTVELPDEVGGVADVAGASLARDSVGRALVTLTPSNGSLSSSGSGAISRSRRSPIDSMSLPGPSGPGSTTRCGRSVRRSTDRRRRDPTRCGHDRRANGTRAEGMVRGADGARGPDEPPALPG